MLTLILCVIGLLLITSKNIAIIGCGTAGSSAAYFLQGYNITIFEKESYCGGRLDQFTIPQNGQIIEIGGANFEEDNKYMKHFIQITGHNYSKTHNEDFTMGIFDGDHSSNKLLFQTSSSDFITILKLIYNYGQSILKVKALAKQHLLQFQQIYKFQNEGKVFLNYDEMQKIIGYQNGTQQTIEQYLLSKGIAQNYIQDFVAGIISSFYNQDYKQVHMIAGMTSISATQQTSYKVDGGNKIVFQSLVKNVLDIDVRYNTEVIQIKQTSNNSYNIVSITNGSYHKEQQFDAVILATLIESQNQINITTINQTQNLFSDKNQLKTQVAHVYIVGGKINSSFFGLAEEEQIPKMLLSRNANFTMFTDLEQVCRACYNGSLFVYKIQSRNELNTQEISRLFTHYTVLKHKVWTPAYPVLKKTTDRPQFHLNENLYYINSMEQFVSNIETEIISARNVANLILKLDQTKIGIENQPQKYLIQEEL